MNEEENVLDNIPAIPNKLLQPDGSVTDLLGNEVSDAVPEYQGKKALPNKFLNADGTYSTLSDILALSKMLTFKGTVATEADLPSSGNHAGDVYYVEDTGAEYVWIENDSGKGSWEELGPIIDLSVYYTKTEADNRFATTEYVDSSHPIGVISEDIADWRDITDGVYILEKGVGLGWKNGFNQQEWYRDTIGKSIVVIAKPENLSKRIAIYNESSIKSNGLGNSAAILNGVTVDHIENIWNRDATKDTLVSHRNTSNYYPSSKAVYDFVTDQITTSITNAIGGSY